MSTCLFPGSFDPPTVGHIDIIRRASALFDHVYVAVMVNTAKTPFCPTEERLDMLRTCCRGLKNVTVVEGRGMTVDLAKACGADALLRGVRGEADGGQEAAMAALNARIGGIDTVALFTAPEYSFVSSTFARDVIHYGGKLEGILPKEIIPRFKNRG